MAKRLTITLTKRRLYLMLAISIILLLSGVLLNRMSAEEPSITGMVQSQEVDVPISDAELVVTGFLIIAVLCGFLVYTARKS